MSDETGLDALEAKMSALEAAFRAGWKASGEGWNGEYPDEGVPWEKSVGRDEYLRWLNAGGAS